MSHGVFVRTPSGEASPLSVLSGVPFVIGAAPVQSAESPADVGAPVLCDSWESAVATLGYSEDWASYPLCEFMYSHFKLYGLRPVVFCNVLDPGGMVVAVPASEFQVVDRKAGLPVEALVGSLSVTEAGGSGSFTAGVDFEAYYSGGSLVVELLPDGAAYGETSLSIGYMKVDVASVTPVAVASGLEAVDKCLTTVGVVPDVICAPGFSGVPEVAAVMAVKARAINGSFRAKALIDIPGAISPEEVIGYKAESFITDPSQIVCWPKVKSDGRVFNLSTHLAALISSVDASNGGIPYESPSNKAFVCDSLCFDSGEEFALTLDEANGLNFNGVFTGLNFVTGRVGWGNHTACYPDNPDVNDRNIAESRMFGWVGNMLVRMFWTRLDTPLNRRLIDSIVDECNIWLNGVVGGGFLYGARVEAPEADNPLDSIKAGIVNLNVFIAPIGAAQEVVFSLRYDAAYVASAFA